MNLLTKNLANIWHIGFFTISFMLLSMSLTLLQAVDPCLGKMNKSMIPQQTLMELLISDITNRRKLCRDAENPKPLKEWKGITIDENGDVGCIKWFRLALKGSLSLEWIPSSVEKMIITISSLRGTLNFGELSQEMKHLVLSSNAFFGEISLPLLPKGMSMLNVSNNKLDGTLCLENLPDAMKGLYLMNNMFRGSICLTKLPLSLTTLSLSQNNLHGAVDLRQLPPNLDGLYLGKNRFTGETLFEGLPKSLKILEINDSIVFGNVHEKIEGKLLDVENMGVHTI